MSNRSLSLLIPPLASYHRCLTPLLTTPRTSSQGSSWSPGRTGSPWRTPAFHQVRLRTEVSSESYLTVWERSLDSEHSWRVDSRLDPLLQGLVSVLGAPSVGRADPKHLNMASCQGMFLCEFLLKGFLRKVIIGLDLWLTNSFNKVWLFLVSHLLLFLQYLSKNGT